MSRYTITKMETKTSAKGLTYGIGECSDEQATAYENVTFFNPIPTVGSYVEGTLEANDYKGKKGWKFQGSNFAKAGVGRPAGMVAAVKAKAEGIAHAQENKQEGIKVSSTFRDATLITIEFLHGTEYTQDDFKKKWLEVRNWLWNNFETTEDKQNVPF